MTRFEILPVKQNGYKVEGYLIFDNQLKSYWKDHNGVDCFTNSKKTANEIANSLNKT